MTEGRVLTRKRRDETSRSPLTPFVCVVHLVKVWTLLTHFINYSYNVCSKYCVCCLSLSSCSLSLFPFPSVFDCLLLSVSPFRDSHRRCLSLYSGYTTERRKDKMSKLSSHLYRILWLGNDCTPRNYAFCIGHHANLCQQTFCQPPLYSSLSSRKLNIAENTVVVWHSCRNKRKWRATG